MPDTAQPNLLPKAWPRFARVAPAPPSTATDKVFERERVREGTQVDDPLGVRGERDRTDAVRP